MSSSSPAGPEEEVAGPLLGPSSPLSPAPPRPQREQAPPLLEVAGLVKRYGRRRPSVLNGVSFRVPRGLLVAVEGENGAGKSTLLGCLVGLLAPDAGQVVVSGSLGYCPQEPALFDTLTCAEQLTLFAAGYGLDGDTAERRARELMERFGCARYAGTRVDRLSGGTRQKVNLIASLLHHPDVLLLDEPYQGFDYETYLSFWSFAEQARDEGRSVVVVSHMHTERHRFGALVALSNGTVEVTGPQARQVRSTTSGPEAVR
ncbi:ABC transporter ATP-binding protein [Streptomyces xiangluensis]|uniref:ABC transporter ATP-binding protein n=1 Tax=Streptomyces xiangluensis TaxID=2665720 RepID=A0ABV8YKU2_9ACTN